MYKFTLDTLLPSLSYMWKGFSNQIRLQDCIESLSVNAIWPPKLIYRPDTKGFSVK